MRYLLFLIVSSLFFIAPLQSNAGELSEKQFTSSIDNNSLEKNFVARAEDKSNETCALANKPFLKSSSNVRTKTFPTTYFDHTSELLYRAYLRTKTKHQINYSFFYTPIGLKLIYPYNYYW
jgi:hypothetical protein